MQLNTVGLDYLWARATREHFNLTPSQLGTLAAIVLFYAIEERPITLEELYQFGATKAGEHEIDPMRAVSELYKQDLVERIGPPHARLYQPSVAGVRRLRA